MDVRRRFADESEKIALDRILRLIQTDIMCSVHMEFGLCLGEKTPKLNELKNIKISLKSRLIVGVCFAILFTRIYWPDERITPSLQRLGRVAAAVYNASPKPYAVCVYIRVRTVHGMYTYSSDRLKFRRW